MPLTIKNNFEGYSVLAPLCGLDEQAVLESQAIHKDYSDKGIIVSGRYNDPIWLISDEVRNQVSLHFAINEVHNKLGQLSLSYTEAQMAIRVFATTQFGYSLTTIQSRIKALRAFLENGSIPNDVGAIWALTDFLQLIPDSLYADEVQLQLDRKLADSSPECGKRRALAYYQSYLRFHEELLEFWTHASSEERILYFPLWFWWRVTAIIPLRPIETVLTPRACIEVIDDKYYLTLRRSLRKGTIQATEYRIEKDYELTKYEVPSDVSETILWYIAATSSEYVSDIDVLFSKRSQFGQLKIRNNCDNHYTYDNLRTLLNRFLEEIVSKRYYIVKDTDNLADNEIQPIRLGDARHIAMISLMMQGGSPEICRELARHDSINISDHYYSNIEQFLDVIGEYPAYSLSAASNLTAAREAIMVGLKLVPIKNGFCLSRNYQKGNYCDCANAVDTFGRIGICDACPYAVREKAAALSIMALIRR